MDKIFIKDLLVRGIIGVHDWERQKPQDILINVTAFADTLARQRPMTSPIAWTTAHWQRKFRRTLKLGALHRGSACQ